jgi:hypothetical protein
MTGELIESTCPTCKRRIVVENSRFTQHTDPRTWDPIARKFEPCASVGKLARALSKEGEQQ